MKKIKSLKTLSSLASVAVVTPVVATACNDNEITKTNIDTFTWSEKGDYNFIMTKDEVIDTFKSNNKTIKEGGDLPDDIYDNVELSTYLASDFWAVYILADDTSSKYTGFINVYVDTQKVNIDTLDWSNEGEYLATLTPDVAKAEFISKNKTQAECGTLPDDIYDNVDITAALNNDSWYFTIITKSTSKRYFGSETKDTSATKVNIDKFNWSIIGDYNVLMSNDEISNKFQFSW